MENFQQIQNVQNPPIKSNSDSESTISLKDIVFIVINNWYWFALSLFVCLVIAGIIFKTKPKEYEYRTTIMVRDDSDRQHHYRTIDAILNNVGEDIGAHSLSDEIYLLKSSSDFAFEKSILVVLLLSCFHWQFNYIMSICIDYSGIKIFSYTFFP